MGGDKLMGGFGLRHHSSCIVHSWISCMDGGVMNANVMSQLLCCVSCNDLLRTALHNVVFSARCAAFEWQKEIRLFRFNQVVSYI